MSYTGLKTVPMLAGTVASASPWQALFARSGYRVYPFQLGAKVRGTSTGTAVTLYGQGALVANDYVIFCDATAYGAASMFIPNLNKIRRVTAISNSDDAVTLDAAVSITAGDYMLVIGADTATTPESAPNYDGSLISLYSDNAAITAVSPKYLSTTTGGSYIGWVGAGTRAVDLLITNSSGTPQIVDPFVATLPNEEVNQIRTYTAAGATPSAAGFKVLKVGQSGSQAITNFTGGTIGQILTVIFTDSNSSIADSGNFKLNSAVASANEMVLVLVYDGTSWYEVGRNNGSGGSVTAIVETEIGTGSSGTLASPAASIDITAIPSGYDDLVLRIWARSSRSATSDTMGIHLNNDTTETNYESTILTGTVSTAASAESSDSTIFQVPGNTSQSNDFGWTTIEIPSYTSAQTKTLTSTYGYRLDATNVRRGVGVTNWENTAAITRITLVSLTSSNFATGTRYLLTGRKSTSV